MCECTPTCRLRVQEGEVFALPHDKRPERAEARRQYFGRLHAKRDAWRDAERKAAQPADLGTAEAAHHWFQSQIAIAMRRRDPALVNAISRAATTAMKLLDVRALEEENAKLRALLAEANPGLRLAR